jgi:Uma2 family endonuclease
MKSIVVGRYGIIEFMSRVTEHRQLIPGSTGWTVHDLDDPKVEEAWEAGHFQIIEGVLAIMPPAYWDNSMALQRLILQMQVYFLAQGQPTDFGCEVDVVVGETRIPKADAVYMSEEDKVSQLRANKTRRKPKGIKYGRLRIPPTLVIENISRGHESEDRIVKRRFYAEAGIPNYWILDVYQKTLECLTLAKDAYALDQIGRGKGKVVPKCFPGLTIELSKIWDD